MIPCTYRQLEIFLAAAEDCHFARTADRLGISQPAVTGHIATLESRLGKALFIRRRGATPLLSSDGQAFLSEARTFLEQGEKIRAFRAKRADKPPTLVRVAAGAHILEDVLRPRLSAFHRRHPGIVVECAHAETVAKGARMLERGAADIMLFSTRETSLPPFHSEVVRPIRFGLYASPAYERHRHASAETISTLPFILPTQGSEPARMVQAALAEAGVVCTNVALRVQFTNVIVDLAADGAGVCAVFETMVEDRVARGDLIKFDLELPPRHRTLFRRKDMPSEGLVAVEGFLRSILRE
jgi:DNA-binding transcriptional LysR family regulator